MTKHNYNMPNTTFYHTIRQIIVEAKQKVVKSVNFTMVETNWLVGKHIVEEEQRGKHRAEYGANLLGYLSIRLTKEIGHGYDKTNLSNMRKFYQTFPILDALRQELTWTHYRSLLRIENKKVRQFYIEEAIANNWNTRALDRQIKSLYYERLLSSGDKKAVEKEMEEKTGELQTEDFLKDPYVLEFLGIKENTAYLEADLEKALLSQLNQFLLELGRGFAFVARQKRISTETKHFYVDLVFYNYILKCFVLIDLKVGELTHQDIGQMDMYVRLFEDKYKATDDNATIGLILCSHKDQTVVKYSVLNDNKQLFASKYMLYLPTEEELRKELERERNLIENLKS